MGGGGGGCLGGRIFGFCTLSKIILANINGCGLQPNGKSRSLGGHALVSEFESLPFLREPWVA